MQEPQMYHAAHKIFKQLTGLILKKYITNFQWHTTGNKILMDVGTGPGDIFMTYVYPDLHQKFDRIICSDISAKMLDFTKNYYTKSTNCEYRLLDITTEEGVPSDLKGKVNHLTCSHVLHWIKDLEKGTVLRNLYDLLSPNGGDCLIIFMPYLTVFDVFHLMQQSVKWGHYLRDINEFVPKSNYSPNTSKEFYIMLKDVGFSDITIEEKTDIFDYESRDVFRDDFKSVCAILKYIPEKQQSEFLDECVNLLMETVSVYPEAKESSTNYCLRYKFIVAHAKKLLK